MTDPRTQSVKSANRALEIVEVLAEQDHPLSFSQLAEQLSYPRSSLHSLLHTLTERRWVEYDSATRGYSVGIRAWQAGQGYLRAVELVARARPLMEVARDRLDETVQLALLDGLDNVYIAKVSASQRLTLASDVGKRLPAHATGLGKVLLAGLDARALDELLRGVKLSAFTRHTVTDHSTLRRQLDLVRQQGFGEDVEEYTVGVRCVAVPVRDHAGQVVAAMSSSVPTVRFDKDKRAQALIHLTEAATALSATLGHSPGGRQHR